MKVTAEEFIRALQNDSRGDEAIMVMAVKLGIYPDVHYTARDYMATVFKLANLVDLPEPTDNRVIWRGEAPEPHPLED